MRAQPARFAAAEMLIDADDDAFQAGDSNLDDLAGDELDAEDWSLEEDVRRLLESR